MKRRGDEKDRFCSSPSMLDPIPLDLKMVRLPAKFRMKTHQKKVLFPVESTVKREDIENQDDEKNRRPIKVDHFPLDLELAILTRLPAKSLLKFLCVSKMWSSTIQSQRFVNSYYAMSCTIRSRFIITFACGAQAKFEDRRLFVFSSSYECEKSSSLATNLDMTIPSVSLCRGAYCTSVHGLIGCIKSGSFIVCNPSTKKFNILPFTGARTSWAYDPVGDQFKSLTMVSYPHRPPDHLVHEVLTFGGGGESSWTRNKLISPPHYTVTKSICINGFVYYGAWTPTRSANPVIVCFDVRFETLSFIEAPRPVVWWGGESILMEYKGKLASISRHPYADFQCFDLWILEDVKTHDWSKQTFQLPFSLGMGKNITSPGTNKAGEIIFAPKLLSYNDVQPFYIFYYNVERKDIRRVRLLGIADDEEFRRRYGIAGECYVWISPEHIESIATL